MVCEKTFKEFLQVCRDERSPQKMAIFASNVSEKKKLKESLLVHRVKINWTHFSHVFFNKNKISLIIFQEGHPGINPNKCDWNYPSVFKKIFKEFLLAHIVKIRSAHYSHVFSQIKTSQTVFENGHPRNISAKFSWNSPNTFREDDFTPHKSTTCRCQQLVVVFKQIKISLTIFEKGQPWNISEIISKSDQPFQWIRNKKFFLSPCSANKSSQPEPWLYTDNNFVNSFWKGSHKEYFCETILKFISDFREEEFFSSFPYSASSPLHHSHVSWGIKISGRNFQKGHPRNISVKLFWNLTSGLIF